MMGHPDAGRFVSSGWLASLRAKWFCLGCTAAAVVVVMARLI